MLRPIHIGSNILTLNILPDQPLAAIAFDLMGTDIPLPVTGGNGRFLGIVCKSATRRHLDGDLGVIVQLIEGGRNSRLQAIISQTIAIIIFVIDLGAARQLDGAARKRTRAKITVNMAAGHVQSGTGAVHMDIVVGVSGQHAGGIHGNLTIPNHTAVHVQLAIQTDIANGVGRLTAGHSTIVHIHGGIVGNPDIATVDISPVGLIEERLTIDDLHRAVPFIGLIHSLNTQVQRAFDNIDITNTAFCGASGLALGHSTPIQVEHTLGIVHAHIAAANSRATGD